MKNKTIGNEIYEAKPGNGIFYSSRRLRFKHMRILGIPAPFMLVLALGCLVTGVLISGLDWYSVTMSGDVELNGSGEISVYLDGALLTDQITAMPLDITELTTGETVIATHMVSSPLTDGNFIVTVHNNMDPEIFSNPLHEFYGYYMQLEDDGANDITDIDRVLIHGHELNYVFTYSLDDHFAQVTDPLPLDISIDIVTKPNEAPTAPDIAKELELYSGDFSIQEYVWDIDQDNNDVTLVGLTQIDGSTELTLVDGMVHYSGWPPGFK